MKKKTIRIYGFNNIGDNGSFTEGENCLSISQVANCIVIKESETVTHKLFNVRSIVTETTTENEKAAK